MAWETRGGRRYYYRSVRSGGRVRKDYLGTGRLAELAARLARSERAERDARAADERGERERLAALDAATAPLDELADDLARGVLLAAGYHQHHGGEWRRRRAQS